jgi:hypothetical protein
MSDYYMFPRAVAYQIRLPDQDTWDTRWVRYLDEPNSMELAEHNFQEEIQRFMGNQVLVEIRLLLVAVTDPKTHEISKHGHSVLRYMCTYRKV